ncbi:MAG: ribonuclease HI [Clostridia bacterium]|nr:ribonuclease HI [Clostridia bacterium]MDE6791106.1 ribonuclease HI [Clostridia bacterium]MDE7400892.1 ribonuclease HI [Clostridia bacterium]
MKQVTLYTDGACSGNPGVGGWGAVLMYKDFEKRISGAEEATTNNRMELFAVISGLECLKEPCEVTVYSDSAYTVNAFNNGWIYGWEKDGWKKADNKQVLNTDLWQRLLALTRTHSVKFVKVKGHADNEYNNICDKLATDAIKNFQSA